MIVDEFLNKLKFTIEGIEGRFSNNLLFRTSERVCQHHNPSNFEYCFPYYKKGHFWLENVYVNFENTPRVVFRLKIDIPFFRTFDHSIHSLHLSPIPLWKKSSYYYFKSLKNLPKLFAYFPSFQRRVSIDDCTIFEKTHFCSLNLVNNFYLNTDLCLNSIFQKHSKCEYSLVKSISNCLILSTENFVFLSHHLICELE